jgi:hypothetical protein
LVEQATADCNLAEPKLGAQHHGLSKFNAPTPKKSAGGDAERLPECPAEVAVAQARESRQLSYRDPSAEVRIEISYEPLRLPRRKAPSNPRSLIFGAYRIACPSRTGIIVAGMSLRKRSQVG